MTKHALCAFTEFCNQWADRMPALFTDYDGTLTPIVAQPELAKLNSEVRTALEKLASVLPIAVVSGRARPNVSEFVGVPGLTYAGSHGFDIGLSDGRIIHPIEDVGTLHSDLEAANSELAVSLAAVPGIRLEPKPFSLAIHYRHVQAADVGLVDAAVARAVEGRSSLRRSGGKKVFELRPALAWDKGQAVLWLLKALDLDRADVVPIYIGDDETDRDAFNALRERGIGIFVGRPEEAAGVPYWLEDSSAVLAFLQRIYQHVTA